MARRGRDITARAIYARDGLPITMMALFARCQSIGFSEPGHLGECVVDSSTTSTAVRVPQPPLEDARRSPINQIGARTRDLVVRRIVERSQLDVAPFSSAI